MVADVHALDAEFGEGGVEHQQAAGDDGAALGRQAGQADGVEGLELQQLVADDSEAGVGDRDLGELHLHRDVADFLDGARRAHGVVPAALAVGRGELLELGGDLGARFLPALARELAVGEEAAGGGDAAHLQAFALDGVEAFADDEFGGTAADVHHQPALAGFRRVAVRHAKVDQARLLAAGDHFDAVAQRRFRRHQEGLRVGELAHGVGGDGAHAARRDGA